MIQRPVEWSETISRIHELLDAPRKRVAYDLAMYLRHDTDKPKAVRSEAIENWSRDCDAIKAMMTEFSVEYVHLQAYTAIEYWDTTLDYMRSRRHLYGKNGYISIRQQVAGRVRPETYVLVGFEKDLFAALFAHDHKNLPDLRFMLSDN